MTDGDALSDADKFNHGEKLEGVVFMESWTAHLPEWAFKISMDFCLRGLRRDMLEEYRRRKDA